MQTSLQMKNKHIVVLGLGLTGMSFVRFLSAQQLAFAVNDSRSNVIDEQAFTKTYPTVNVVQGQWDEALIASADLLLVSPGVDITIDVIRRNISNECEVWGDVELYCRLTNTPMVAVTGSNGKSTVVSLVDHIGKQLGVNTQLGGNVGVPVLDILDQKPELLILELSSFQLETMSSMNAVAATVLNLSDDHLDRHLTMDNYRHIKQRIYKQCQTAIYNRDDALTQLSSMASEATSLPKQITSIGSDKPAMGEFGLDNCQGETWLFYGVTPLLPIAKLPIAGVHNALNCLAALALGNTVGWPIKEMVNALTSFSGLAHRCQLVPSHDGVTWINDSKATNVGATLAAINGLAPMMNSSQKMILIAGGEGKGADFTPLAQPLADSVSHVITLGKDAKNIAALHANSIEVTSLEQAVITASQLAEKGDIVLLSPACASIDMFKNFAERGDVFVKTVQSMKEAC